ncbi:MAG: cupredoxin domain-containing protein, partial [Chloroflexota bacterium]|nr:cupredoxin domain-containing protein [Chloroflexota bacterium]
GRHRDAGQESGDPEAELRALAPRLRRIDDAPVPSPAFVRRLEEDLMGTASHASVPGFPGSANGHSPDVEVPRRPALHRERRRGWPITELAVAAVLLFAVATTFVANQPPGGGTGDGDTRLAALQDASPTIEAAGCTVAPRTEPVIHAEGTPAGLPGTPAASIEYTEEIEPNRYGILEVREEQLPAGEPAPPDAVAGIEATIAELAACTEAGRFDVQVSLFTDDYFRRPEVRGGEGVGFPALPRTVREARQATVRDARLLPDGRVGAIVEGPGFGPSFIVVDRDGRWLIDEGVVVTPAWIVEGGSPPAGGNVGVGVSASCDGGGGEIQFEGRTVSAGVAVSTEGAFLPGELTMSTHDPLSLTLLNCRDETVGFVIDELGVHQRLGPGETTSISFDAEVGTYAYYSDLPGQREAGLVGTLSVIDQGTPTPCVPAEEFDPDEDVC